MIRASIVTTITTQETCTSMDLGGCRVATCAADLRLFLSFGLYEFFPVSISLYLLWSVFCSGVLRYCAQSVSILATCNQHDSATEA